MEYFSSAPPRLDFGLCKRNLTPRTAISIGIESAKVIVGITIHNQRDFIRASLQSALAQEIEGGQVGIIVLDDSSTDEWELEVTELLLDSRVLVIDGNCGSPSHSRNAILDFVDQNLENTTWVARLDADDVLDNPLSVSSLVIEAERVDALFAIGSNHLVIDGVVQTHSNIANPDVLLNHSKLMNFIERFCTGKGENELPSCNLLLKTHSGFRYPLVKSAEDHWLVAQLLMFYQKRAAIVRMPIYARYSLSGAVTDTNRTNGKWQLAREQLLETTKEWTSNMTNAGEILGYGQEGVVSEYNSYIFKYFYKSQMQLAEIERIQQLTQRCTIRFPQFDYFLARDESIACFYRTQVFFGLTGVIELAEIKEFLLDLAKNKVTVTNIKRDNLKISDQGRLIYIDIGKDIVELTPTALLECAAKLYAIAYLNFSDHELAWRKSCWRQEDQLNSIPGFADFYVDLIQALYPHCGIESNYQRHISHYENVTLLIKACSQDALALLCQVKHIVGNLTCDHQFNKIVLLLDSFQGPFLRQYREGDFITLVTNARELLDEKWIDEILIAPQSLNTIGETYKLWYDIVDVTDSHTKSGAPLFSQIWAFDQIDTHYVLQCDVDVLIGRKGIGHNYLQDMLVAIDRPDVWSIGFNIPKSEDGFKAYFTSELGFVPEIRFCLLDLNKIKGARPLVNHATDGSLDLMWHRSLEAEQRAGFYKSLRGGDSRTFYIHPANTDKLKADFSRLRDLIGQGFYPSTQAEKWDLVTNADWLYPERNEELIFLIKGRNTEPTKISRAFNSLLIQSDQNFGVIYIDDASDSKHPYDLRTMLDSLGSRVTLIRREQRAGYIPNFIFAVNTICKNKKSLIAVLDQDDALMSNQVVRLLKNAKDEGVDLINGLMFRPTKPLKIYRPEYDFPRGKGGANVWSHLRAFTKELFESVPLNEFKFEDDWFEQLTDFVTMIPMAELAQKPLFINEDYCYWHERASYSNDKKQKQENIKKILFQRPSLKQD